MFLTALLLAGLIALLTAYFVTLKSRYDYFRLRGIPGPSHLFFFGHYRTIWSAKFYSRLLQSWTQQYGPIYGLYDGTRPLYVVSDVDFLQEVFIKQFSCFHSHRFSFLLRMSDARPLISADVRRWRHCAFGIDTDMQNDINNEFMLKSAACFEKHVEHVLLTKWSYLMPWLTPFLIKFVRGQLAIMGALHNILPTIFPDILETIPTLWLQSKVDRIIDTRRKSSETIKRIDLLQLLLDATTTQSDKPTSENELHIDEVKANAFLFMAAGYETTSTALAYSTYILATKPDIQHKLHAEIDVYYENKIDYDLITKMTYMDLFIREVLRMFPMSTMGITRQCNETTTVCGHQIDKGTVIQPDIFSIHYNSEIWGPDDPNQFLPERHATERHPLAYLAFGAGPRACIGMRFALMEMKMCLAHLLRNYTVLPGEHLEEGFKLHEIFVIQPDAIYIKLEKRC
ncbi:unnamed protein product [Rotaria sp. Silwood2]|nr:unnamed protein product [Rotaria sp. Silwood2]CAF4408490.1 unnamed protein product [Rotaria sp. Silwood2]